jgi:hypothetical protein
VHSALTEFGPKPEDGPWEDFSQRLRFAGGGFEKTNPGSLLDVIEDGKRDVGTDARFVHYLAIPPAAFGKVTEGLRQHGLTAGARVVYEKPFGTSPESFRELDRVVHEVLQEDQVFRIDHFLGKEGTQDLHALRFGNGVFDRLWSAEHVRAVQIDVPETLDIADRATFYDATGAMLDMIVTHLFQLAAEVAMETPASRATCSRPGRTSSPGSGRSTRTRWCSASSRATGTPRAWRRTRRPTRSSPPGCGSTRRAGTACRSCSVPASSSRAAPSRSAWSSRSRTVRWPTSCRPTGPC